MLLSLSIIGIILSVILLIFHVRKKTSAIYLGIFFSLISLYGFIQYVLVYSKSVFLVSIIFINVASLPFLIGPMLYWYVRSVLTDDSRLKKWDLLHVFPMLISLVTSLTYIFSHYSYKVQMAARIVENSDYLQTFKAIGLHKIIPITAIYESRSLLFMGYALWSAGLFIHYLWHKKKEQVLSHQYFMTKWLTVLLGFTVILSVSHFLILTKAFISENTIVYHTLNVFQLLSLVGLMGLLISPFFFPEILYGLPRLPKSEASLLSKARQRKLKNGMDKKHSFHIESDYLHFIDQQADSCMKEIQPYLRPDFNLTQFSVLIHIPVHHLSYYFRQKKKQHFNDYMNTWRVKHAKNLIIEGKSNDITMEGIGLISGFPNRNSFRTTFQKMEGISPSAFAAQNKETTIYRMQ